MERAALLPFIYVMVNVIMKRQRDVNVTFIKVLYRYCGCLDNPRANPRIETPSSLELWLQLRLSFSGGYLQGFLSWGYCPWIVLVTSTCDFDDYGITTCCSYLCLAPVPLTVASARFVWIPIKPAEASIAASNALNGTSHWRYWASSGC